MPMFWFSILDTAVKVGLGAAISGTVQYMDARRKHDEGLHRARLESNRRKLEEIGDSVIKFSQGLRDYMAQVSNWYDSDREDDLSELAEEVNKSTDKYYEAFHELTSAELKLGLIGEAQAKEKLRCYGELGQELFKEFYVLEGDLEKGKLGSKPFEDDDVEALKENLVKAHEDLLQEMGKIYNR